VHCFELFAPLAETAQGDVELDGKERARQTYVRSLDVTREVMSSARLGKSPGLKRVKRAVQGIVDAILNDSASLIGLTTLREFDEYTFVHSVNVTILSVALGRRLGLTKPQLLDLGLAALLHDFGKSRVPLEVLNKRGSLDDAERAALQSHTWQGVLAMFALPTGSARPWRAMTTAYEHHMRIDLSGYPKPLRDRRLTLFSKIIAVADGFDAATTSRVYQDAPWTPADVLRGMRDNTRLGLDPIIVKAFINLTGIYPVGTLVVLDSLELALVVATNPDSTALSRPLVRLITDALGNRVADALVYDLTACDASGQFHRTVIRTEDPQRYGINISDYFA
jgi:HD-GYP domain-containing protein (c-di-GMP phosphodiesterase class II)